MHLSEHVKGPAVAVVTSVSTSHVVPPVPSVRLAVTVWRARDTYQYQLRATRPSTAAIGNLGLIATLRYLDGTMPGDVEVCRGGT